MSVENDFGSAPDLLLDCELRIARRADELAQSAAGPTQLPLYCWMIAEREIFGNVVLGEVIAPAEPWSSGVEHAEPLPRAV